MLNNIDPLLNGNLLKAMRDMGHGDELIVVDANFPAASLGIPVIRYDGVGTERLLKAILTHLPLDDYVSENLFRMEVVEDASIIPDICQNYVSLLKELGHGSVITPLERFEFYRRAKEGFAVVATGERAQYANLILKKGVVADGRY